MEKSTKARAKRKLLVRRKRTGIERMGWTGKSKHIRIKGNTNITLYKSVEED